MPRFNTAELALRQTQAASKRKFAAKLRSLLEKQPDRTLSEEVVKELVEELETQADELEEV